MSDNTEFRKELEERTKQINEQIESYLPEEKGHQKTIFEAMNYSVKAGGKRLRPLFMQEICRLFKMCIRDRIRETVQAEGVICSQAEVEIEKDRKSVV